MTPDPWSRVSAPESLAILWTIKSRHLQTSRAGYRWRQVRCAKGNESSFRTRSVKLKE
jgi:hypothetical protein